MPSSNPSSLHERPVIATQSKPSASFPPSSSSASHPSSSSSGSSTWVVLVCLLVWLHGASFGATLGDGVLKPLMVLTVMFFGPIIAVWSLPAARRLLVAFLYFLMSSYVMALISSLAWFRNPAHLPPLPDIIHDLIPQVQQVNLPFWHKEPHMLPDLFISSLTFSTLLFVLFNQKRWIILRRFFVIYGTLMCMRSVTIVVTNLPDALPKCHEITRFHHWNQISARWVVLRAVKLLVPVGEMTCGDMVFSGHSMILCLEAMIWHTYYKRAPGLRFNYVKLAVWGCVIMGLISILAVRLHYTLDVILAVYFSITVWSAYHRIAHDVAVGHHFSMIWLIDHVFIYPAIRWLETPQNVEDLETAQAEAADSPAPASHLHHHHHALHHPPQHEELQLPPTAGHQMNLNCSGSQVGGASGMTHVGQMASAFAHPIMHPHQQPQQQHNSVLSSLISDNGGANSDPASSSSISPSSSTSSLSSSAAASAGASSATVQPAAQHRQRAMSSAAMIAANSPSVKSHFK